IAREFAVDMPVSRILVNTMASVGAVGGTTGLLPSMTLGCGTFGGNITSDNLSAKHLINIKRMAYGIKEVQLPKHIDDQPDNKADQVVSNVINTMGTNGGVDPDMVKDLVSEILKQLSK